MSFHPYCRGQISANVSGHLWRLERKQNLSAEDAVELVWECRACRVRVIRLIPNLLFHQDPGAKRFFESMHEGMPGPFDDRQDSMRSTPTEMYDWGFPF